MRCQQRRKGVLIRIVYRSEEVENVEHWLLYKMYWHFRGEGEVDNDNEGEGGSGVAENGG